MKTVRMLLSVSLLSLTLLSSSIARADDEKKEDKEVEAKAKTSIDFDSTMIDGKMKAPSGFMLQGRNRQSLTNMVKLRSNFRPQLNDSKAAVKALVK